MGKAPEWLDEPGLQRLFAATRAVGGEARVVGGAVRDHLLGRAGGDVDLASTLTPEATMELAKVEAWKAIPTGIAHGTVTLVLPERVVEVTTLRHDVATDGRHAVVEYTDDFAADASRRDFTINALSMDADGAVYDYHGGRADLDARRLCFIGHAAARIAEDGLRILRYFRFMAQLGFTGDDAALAACADARGMIAELSGERIAQEMKKLLTAKNPAVALQAMAESGLDHAVTKQAWQLTPLHAVIAREQEAGMTPNPWVRLLALMAPDARESTAHYVAERWKLSRAERAALLFLAGTESTDFRRHSPVLVARARNLRRDATEAEKRLWHCLSRRQTGYFFRRQHPLEGFIVDFICTKHRLIIELDGGQHATATSHDTRRSRVLESKGYRILRFWNHDVLENIEGVISTILAALPPPERGRLGGGDTQAPKAVVDRNDTKGSTPTQPFPFQVEGLKSAQVKEWLRQQPRDWVLGAVLLRGGDAALLALAQHWEVPVFPVTARDLLKAGYTEGPALGAKLKEIEQRWVDSDYTLSKAELLVKSELPDKD